MFHIISRKEKTDGSVITIEEDEAFGVIRYHIEKPQAKAQTASFGSTQTGYVIQYSRGKDSRVLNTESHFTHYSLKPQAFDDMLSALRRADREEN